MRLPRPVLTSVLGVAFWAVPVVAGAQPALEQLRFDPPQSCLRETFRWAVSYRGIPGGLAAAKDVEMEGLWDGPGERPLRSVLTPTMDDLQRYTTDQGRFESRLLHWGPPRKAPGAIRYTLRVVLADGRELTSTTSVRYVDGCPTPAVPSTLAAGPTGRIGILTTTPSATEFLQAIRPSATTLIWGDLELPPARTPPVDRIPAVVLVHGSGGIGPREDRWADELRLVGLATFMLDSFTGRGIISTAEDQSQLHSLAMVGDAYRALELLATHPRIDPGRIAVMGFSRGGIVALYSALTRFQRLHGPAGVRFAQHVAFYPGCKYTFVDDLPVTDRPIRIFQGTADDLAPPEACRAYVERLGRAGADAQVAEYAGALHGFDRPGDGTPRHNPREQNASRCFWEERPQGQLVNRDTGQAFALSDPCVTLGGTSGADPTAYRAAREAVKALIAPKAASTQ